MFKANINLIQFVIFHSIIQYLFNIFIFVVTLYFVFRNVRQLAIRIRWWNATIVLWNLGIATTQCKVIK